jgi:hypothetical protein
VKKTLPVASLDGDHDPTVEACLAPFEEETVRR